MTIFKYKTFESLDKLTEWINSTKIKVEAIYESQITGTTLLYSIEDLDDDLPDINWITRD